VAEQRRIGHRIFLLPVRFYNLDKSFIVHAP